MVDRSALYPGAVVTVPAEFAGITADVATVAIRNYDGTISTAAVALAAILSVEPRPLAVGDRVRTPAGTDGEVKCIVEDEAAVLRPGIGLVVYGLSTLTRLPDEPAPAEPPMRFKVGDRVVHRERGRGEVITVDVGPLTDLPYQVSFRGVWRWVRDADLSPAPAEERAP